MTADHSKIRFNPVVALDLEDLYAVITKNGADDPEAIRARKVINRLRSSKGTLYRTKRGRIAVQVPPSLYSKMRSSLPIVTSEGYDGTLSIVLAPAQVKEAA